jgi:MATE family multidrug resistance protein
MMNAVLFRKFFKVSRDIFIRTLILIFAFSFFTTISARSGDLILAANTILINLWTVMAYGIDGFAFAAESLIGRYLGAKDRNKLNKAVKLIFSWGFGLALIFSLIYFIFPEWILKIFTDKRDVLDLALKLMIWTQLAPLIGCFSYIWDGIFIGATATAAMRNTMIISLFVFYLPFYYITRDIFGVHALWFSLTIFMLVRGTSLAFMYKRAVLHQF